MDTTVKISKKNEVFLKVQADPHVYYELSDVTFDVPGIKFMLSIEVSIGTEKLGYSTQGSGEIYVGLR